MESETDPKEDTKAELLSPEIVVSEREEMERQSQKNFTVNFCVEVLKSADKNTVFNWSPNVRTEYKKAIRVKTSLIESDGCVALNKVSNKILEEESTSDNFTFPFPSKEAKESVRDLISQKLYECYKKTPLGEEGLGYRIRLKTELVDGMYIEKGCEIGKLQDGVDVLFRKTNVTTIRVVLNSDPYTKMVSYADYKTRTGVKSFPIVFHGESWKELASEILSDWEELEVGRRLGHSLGLSWQSIVLVYPNAESRVNLKKVLAKELERIFYKHNDYKRHMLLIDLNFRFNKKSVKLISSKVKDLLTSP